MPRSWAALAVDSEIMPDSAARGRPELRLTRWAWWDWRIGRRMIDRTKGANVASANALWCYLSEALSRRGTVVCLCADAVQALTLLGAWERIDSGGVTLCRSPMILTDPPTAIRLTLPGHPGKLLLLDTRNFGVKIPAGIDSIDRVATVADGLPDMIRKLALGSLQPTAGAQALYGYRRSYMAGRPYIHCRPRALQLEQEALHGGRAECYRIGRVEGPIYELDYSGFYGSIMRDLPVPYRLRRWGDGATDGLRSEWQSGAGVIAQVQVYSEEPSLPCLRDKITVWPVGQWWTTLAGPELDYALNSLTVQQIGQWASYDLAPALSLYARRLLDYCYGEYRNPVADMRSVGKALLVSIVGKMAQKSRRWEDRPNAQAVHKWGSWHRVDSDTEAHLYRSIAGVVQRQVGSGFSPTACPAIAAFIYAEGRQKLWQAQLVAGRDQVYYCHTDSLFVSARGYGRLAAQGMIADSVPGKLTLKGTHDWIHISGVSHYRTPTRSVCSGVVASAGGARCAGEAAYYLDTVGYALGESRPPLPILHPSAPEHTHPYLHGQIQTDGTVTPWRL